MIGVAKETSLTTLLLGSNKKNDRDYSRNQSLKALAPASATA